MKIKVTQLYFESLPYRKSKLAFAGTFQNSSLYIWKKEGYGLAVYEFKKKTLVLNFQEK